MSLNLASVTAIVATTLSFSIDAVPAGDGAGQDALVAVAANFIGVADRLVDDFHQRATCRIGLTGASSGTLYAQIRNGAPFDAFLSADTMRPALLESQGAAVTGSRFTYATGRLVVWAPNQPADADARALLESGTLRHVAIAMPSTAPYGAAAIEVLRRLGLETTRVPSLVRGESVTRTYQFVASGNADAGFVALSQVGRDARGLVWIVDDSLYAPIRQQAVLLHPSPHPNPCAVAFLDYLRGPEARAIIARSGYGGAPDA